MALWFSSPDDSIINLEHVCSVRIAKLTEGQFEVVAKMVNEDELTLVHLETLEACQLYVISFDSRLSNSFEFDDFLPSGSGDTTTLQRLES